MYAKSKGIVMCIAQTILSNDKHKHFQHRSFQMEKKLIWYSLGCFFMYDKHKKLRSNSWKKIEILSILFGVGKLERLSGENMRIVRENNKNNIYSFCGNCSAHIQKYNHIYLSMPRWLHLIATTTSYREAHIMNCIHSSKIIPMNLWWWVFDNCGQFWKVMLYSNFDLLWMNVKSIIFHFHIFIFHRAIWIYMFTSKRL